MSEAKTKTADIPDDARIARIGDWLSADTGDGCVMMSPKVARYIGLSETGAAIWNLLETPRTLADLCADLARQYDADGRSLRADVVEFVRGLVDRGALTVG